MKNRAGNLCVSTADYMLSNSQIMNLQALVDMSIPDEFSGDKCFCFFYGEKWGYTIVYKRRLIVEGCWMPLD